MTLTKMNSRVVGLLGIASRMANWNADFTGLPKTTSDGMIFASDKALKYSIKRWWDEEGKNVLYIRSYKVKVAKDEAKMQPRDLEERYQQLFEEGVSKKSVEVLKRLFSCVDVMNFGATFAVKEQNLSITGAVQIGQGFNKYPETNVEVQDILSPFRNSNEKSEDKDATSLGKKRTVNEAHYIYPFTVNPNHYDHFADLDGFDDFEGYTEEAYEDFKQGALLGATAQQTNSKSGAENSFALFIRFREGSLTYLPNLDTYATVYRKDEKIVYDLSAISTILNDVENEIDQIELYLNPYACDVLLEVPRLQRFNIVNQIALA